MYIVDHWRPDHERTATSQRVSPYARPVLNESSASKSGPLSQLVIERNSCDKNEMRCGATSPGSTTGTFEHDLLLHRPFRTNPTTADEDGLSDGPKCRCEPFVSANISVAFRAWKKSFPIPTQIDLYWRPGCGFCSMLRGQLDKLGVERVEHNIWDDPSQAAVVRAIRQRQRDRPDGGRRGCCAGQPICASTSSSPSLAGSTSPPRGNLRHRSRVLSGELTARSSDDR